VCNNCAFVGHSTKDLKICNVIFLCDVNYVPYMRNIVLGDVMPCHVAKI
jgi:hypothetical protein